ncbi:MAG: hypothetical protein JWN03_4928 [Nocardia sp.]|uniref:hypothetical protein n=1 Tax=Nocardia sp. TaxID=1821 RepID=UPI0026280E6C|nr:hypothetical protein [Nocardia sp.]MCU1644653.1 hypothetical protein [Nocardia sp.]
MGFEDDRTGGLTLWAVAAWGGIAAVLTAPIAAALVGSIYRFPIPFGDNASGVDDAVNAALASVFYLVMGEGVVLAALGGVAGYFIARAVGPGLLRPLALAVLAAFGLTLLGALILAAFR